MSGIHKKVGHVQMHAERPPTPTSYAKATEVKRLRAGKPAYAKASAGKPAYAKASAGKPGA